MNNFSEDMARALNILKKGGIILYPTDTVWGIGCDATNSAAIKKIFKLKQRTDSKSMLSLVGSFDQLLQWVENVPDTATEYMRNSDYPVTIIYDSPKDISPLLKSQDGSAGFRVSRDYFSSQLAIRLGKPLVSTSANISGLLTPRSFGEISESILSGVDYVCTSCREKSENTGASEIIKISDNGNIQIIRKRL